jgi:hypothetical protein
MSCLLLRHTVSETGFCLRLQVEHTQVRPTERASLSPVLCPPEDGDTIRSPIHYGFKTRQVDGQCSEL